MGVWLVSQTKKCHHLGLAPRVTQDSSEALVGHASVRMHFGSRLVLRRFADASVASGDVDDLITSVGFGRGLKMRVIVEWACNAHAAWIFGKRPSCRSDYTVHTSWYEAHDGTFTKS